MLANNVEQTTTTTGTGTVDLDGTVSGADDFSEHFVSAEAVPYVILNGGNDDIEEGIGVFTDAAPDTLARTVVITKTVAGVTSDYTATGLNLTGTSTVLVGPSASTTMSGNNSGNFRDLTGQLTDAKVPDNVVNGASSKSRGNLDTPFFPGVLTLPTKITKIGVFVQIADAGDPESRVAIYESLPSGLPGRLIVESGDLDVTSTGLVMETLGTPLRLPSGVYFFCHKNAGTTLKIHGVSQNGFWNPHGLMASQTPNIVRDTLAAGAFPDPAPTSGYSAEAADIALMRFSSS